MTVLLGAVGLLPHDQLRSGLDQAVDESLNRRATTS
jgi:hypothetical protein